MQGGFKAGEFLVQPDLNRLSGPQGSVSLEPKAMQVLLCLSDQAGQVVGKDELLQSVWPDTFVTEDVLKNAVWELRKAFRDDARKPRFIQTIPKKGYRLIAPLSRSGPAASPPAVQSGWILRFALAAAAVVLVLLAAYVAWEDRPVVSSPSRTRLAVLPFTYVESGSPAVSGQEQLADGMTIELITLLGRLDPDRLGVIAPLSAMHYKTAGKDLAQVGGELRVEYVVEGSLQLEGERLRLHAQLSRADDQTQLWAGSYLRDDLTGLLDVQMELAAAIASEIQVRLQSQPDSRIDRSRTLNSKAYEAFLRGNHHQFIARDFDQAVEAFQEAVQLDPGYALAHAKLAYATIWGSRLSPRQALDAARIAARRALQLAPNLAEAHMAEGLVQLYQDLDWQGAEQSFLRALQLDPGSATSTTPSCSPPAHASRRPSPPPNAAATWIPSPPWLPAIWPDCSPSAATAPVPSRCCRKRCDWTLERPKPTSRWRAATRLWKTSNEPFSTAFATCASLTCRQN
ncbi:MAG: winged helix-turn-helix domain-containing protein [Acidobacteriota bacterium]